MPRSTSRFSRKDAWCGNFSFTGGMRNRAAMRKYQTVTDAEDRDG